MSLQRLSYLVLCCLVIGEDIGDDDAIATDVYPSIPKQNSPGLYSGELASSLYTFQDHACDGSTLSIRCPRGSTISVQFGVWGRQQPSQKLCPIPRPDTPYAVPLPEPTAPEDTNCLSERSLTVVLRECQDRRRCHLKAIADTFRHDPCPGTNKYLEVAYKCKPHEFHTHLSCEGQDMVLICPKKNTRIALYSAKFGRTVAGEKACPSGDTTLTADCYSETTYEAVLNRCHGRQTCTIPAIASVLGNPCPLNTRKYLRVVYSCVPKKILKALQLEPSLGGRLAPDYAGIDSDLDSIPVVAGSSRGVVDSERRGHLVKETSSAGLGVLEKKGKAEKKKVQAESGVLRNASDLHYTELPPTVTPCNDSATGQFVVGMVTSWMSTVHFLRDNEERVILYMVLGLCGGLLCLLVIIIAKIIQHQKKRSKKLELTDAAEPEARLVSETFTPVRSNTINRNSLQTGSTVGDEAGAEEAEASVEIVRFDSQLRLPNGRASRTLTHYYT